MKREKKKWLLRAFSAAVIMAVALTAAAPPAQAAAKGTVKAVKVTNLPAKTLVLKKGKSKTLKVKVTASKGTVSQKVTFASNKKSVATVNSKGKVTAKGAGTAKITITSKANKKKKTAITVKVGTPVSKVTLNKKSVKLDVQKKKTVTLKADVGPDSALIKDVVWTSSDTKVASVSKGKVTAKRQGTAVITAAAKDGSGKKAECVVKVNDKNALTVAAWDPSFNIPALKAAEKEYKKINKNFYLVIDEKMVAAEVEMDIMDAAENKTYSDLPEIVLFQDHSFKSYQRECPKAWRTLGSINVNWKNFADEKLSYSTVGKKHYGIPLDNSTVICAYRTDLLKKAGYTIDDLTGITWDKFLEIGKDVYKKTKMPLLSINKDGNDFFYMMLQAEGVSQFKNGKPNLKDNKTLIEIFEVMDKMIDAKVLKLDEDWGSYTDSISKGKVAGVMNGNWILPTIQAAKKTSGKWDITSMPTLTGKEGYASNGGSSLYITTGCSLSKVALAQKFLAKTFGSSTAVYDNALKKGGVISTYLPARNSAYYKKGVKFFGNQPIYKEIVAMSDKVPTVEQSDFHYQCREYLGQALEKVRSGKSIKSSLKWAENQLKGDMGL